MLFGAFCNNTLIIVIKAFGRKHIGRQMGGGDLQDKSFLSLSINENIR